MNFFTADTNFSYLWIFQFYVIILISIFVQNEFLLLHLIFTKKKGKDKDYLSLFMSSPD